MTREPLLGLWRGLLGYLRVGGARACSANVREFRNPGLISRKAPRDFVAILLQLSRSLWKLVDCRL
jgi:hypothetical protein